MPSPRRRTLRALFVSILGVAVAVPLAVGASGIGPPRAAVTERADRVGSTVADVVTVYNSGELRADVEARALRAAVAAGGDAVVGGSASLGMTALRRDGVPVQVAPPGFAYPMGTTVLSRDVVGPIMGLDVAAAMDDTSVVMSSLTAGLRGARPGDRISLTATWGGQVAYTIGAVVDDAVTGGTEILMTPEAAARVGLSRDSRVVVYGFDSRAAIDRELAARGVGLPDIRVRRSWDPADPDGTIGMARTKQLLGEFAYRVNPNGSVSVDAGWRSANIVPGGIWLYRLQTGCHRTVRAALADAVDEIVAAGLGWTLDYANANLAGGCYYPRFSRITPNSSIGFLSRHSWGMALDTNTVSNCQGCDPSARPGGFAFGGPSGGGCRAVRIFRKHGFAWGGNFIRPDGMHFEYVGERRDLLPSPSRFCPNPTGNALVVDPDDLPVEETERARLFQDDGLMSHGQESH